MPQKRKRSPSDPKVDANLARALGSLERTIRGIPDDYSHIVHPGKHLFFTYLKGIVYGLGALTAVAIIIPLIVALMQRVPWSPIVSNFVEDVVQRMEKN